MAECDNCGSDRVQLGVCFACGKNEHDNPDGPVQTAEAKRAPEKAVAPRAKRKR